MEVNGVSPALYEQEISCLWDMKEIITIAATALYEQKISYLWHIKNIYDHKFEPGEYITSSRFNTDDIILKSDWQLRLYPSGYDSNSKEEMILVLITTNSYGKGEHIIEKCEFSILDSDREKFHELHFEDLFKNPIEDLLEMRSKTYSLDKKNLKFQKFIHGGTLSILCELNASTYLEGIKATVRQEVRMWSANTVIKQCSTITDTITATEKTVPILYGESFVQVKYKASGNSAIFELLDHPDIKHIWCRIIMNYYNPIYSSQKLRFVWNGKLKGAFVPPSSFPSGHPVKTLDLIMSTTFVAIGPKDSFECDFITAKQEMQQNYKDLLTQPNFGDVSLYVGGKTLRAHKDILAARSEVFAAMFAANMLEASTNSICVTEFQFETIHALLKHIYYGITEVCGVDIAELC